MRPKIDLFLVLLLLINPSCAKNLGTYGPVFEIREESLLKLIEKRLQTLKESGTLETYQQELAQKAEEKVKRPTPVAEIGISKTYSQREYDPSFIVSQDIKDHQGNFIAKKGDSYNPLEYASFGVPLIFIDGDDDAHIQWAISQKGKIILINGAPLELEKNYTQPFYFDQGGVLTSKFSIEEVPAKVSQQDKHLLIESIPVFTHTSSQGN